MSITSARRDCCRKLISKRETHFTRPSPSKVSNDVFLVLRQLPRIVFSGRQSNALHSGTYSNFPVVWPHRLQEKGAAAEERKSPARDKSPAPTKLHISRLTRNVTAEHISEIFSHYGTLVSCTLAMDPKVQLPKGYAVVEFTSSEEAEKAKDYMDGAQLDGNVIG